MRGIITDARLHEYVVGIPSCDNLLFPLTDPFFRWGPYYDEWSNVNEERKAYETTREAAHVPHMKMDEGIKYLPCRTCCQRIWSCCAKNSFLPFVEKCIFTRVAVCQVN